jgi:hypothetical protein
MGIHHAGGLFLDPSLFEDDERALFGRRWDGAGGEFLPVKETLGAFLTILEFDESGVYPNFFHVKILFLLTLLTYHRPSFPLANLFRHPG